MQSFIFVLMIIFAIAAIQTNVLRRSIIYLCVLSLLSSFTYLLYKAPDVAIAEAIIGSTLSTILFLVALKKYRIFRIYLTKTSGHQLTTLKSRLVANMRKFVIHEELELDVIHTSHDYAQAMDLDDYDLIVEEKNNLLYIHGDTTNYHYDNLANYLNKEMHNEVVFDEADEKDVDE